MYQKCQLQASSGGKVDIISVLVVYDLVFINAMERNKEN